MCIKKKTTVKQKKMCHHEFISLGLQLRPDLEAFCSFRLLFSLLCGFFRRLWCFLLPALRFLIGLLSTFSADQQTQQGHGLNGGLLRKQPEARSSEVVLGLLLLGLRFFHWGGFRWLLADVGFLWTLEGKKKHYFTFTKLYSFLKAKKQLKLRISPFSSW